MCNPSPREEINACAHAGNHKAIIEMGVANENVAFYAYRRLIETGASFEANQLDQHYSGVLGPFEADISEGKVPSEFSFTPRVANN